MTQADSLKTGQKFKKTEIGEIPVDWKTTSLGEIISYVKGKKPSQIIDNSKDGYSPYLSPDFLRGNQQPLYAFISNDIILTEDDDIILLWDGSNAGEFFKGKKGVLSSTMAKIELKERYVDKDYLLYHLKTTEHILSIQTRGTGIPHVDRAVLFQIVIPFPPLPEQKKIAKILITVDDAINQSDQIIEKTKELKRGLMQQLLTRGNGHTKFKKTKIGEIPVDWDLKRIKDFCVLGRGRVINQKEIDSNPGPYPVYSSQSKASGSMGSINSYDFDGEYVTWTTDGAYAGTVFYRRGRFNCTNVCGTLKSKEPFIDMLFLSFVLGKKTKKHVVYCGNPKLMNNVMAQISVQIPPLSEQMKIAEILTTIDDQIEKEIVNRDKLETLKKGLMQVLLTGKLRVRV